MCATRRFMNSIHCSAPKLPETAPTCPRSVRVPELTFRIQVLVDERRVNGQFILTGSQNFRTSDRVVQFLAGRTAIVRLLPFSMEELRRGFPDLPADVDTSLFRGMYPRVWDQGLDPVIAYGAYVETYLERDLRQPFCIKDLARFQRFLALCAGRGTPHGLSE